MKMDMELEQERGKSLPHDLFHKLRDDILQNKIKQGEKLTEQRICQEYQVSRTPVREAFQKLELDGLIEIIPNRGAFVLGLTRQDIEDMYELRSAYEAIAVKWAIDRMSEEEYADMQEAFELMEFYTMKKDPVKMLAMNTRFHQIIYNGTKNRMLQHILTSYQVYTKNTKVSPAYITEYMEQVLSEHRRIFEAFQAKDKEAASLAAVQHMQNGKNRAGFGTD